MISDLRSDSGRWRQEQRTTGTRGSSSPLLFEMSGITVPDKLLESYVGSSTYHASSAATAGRPDRRHGDSPSVDGPPYGLPPSARDRERLQSNRMPPSRIDSDRMDIDPPMIPQPERRHREPERGYQPEPRGYAPDGRAYPQESRPSYQPEQPLPSGYGGRQPVTSSYPQDPRYATSNYPANDGAPPGYVRQGNFYVPISAYEAPPAMPPSRSEAPQYQPGPYGQPPLQGRDARGDPRGDPRGDLRGDPRGDPRDPRYTGQPDYSSDPRYAYPSPAATTVSVSARDREPITSPPQPRFARSGHRGHVLS